MKRKILLWLGVPGVLFILGILIITTLLLAMGDESNKQKAQIGSGSLIGSGCTLTGEIDRGKFDARINTSGVFTGKAEAFISAAAAARIDPVLLAAIAMHETGNGTSKGVIQKNNPGGMMDPATNWSTQMAFASLDKGIAAMALNLNRLYISKGHTTIDQIAGIYAPIGAANDPDGMNKYWPSTVTAIAQELGGTLECTVTGEAGGIAIDENLKGDYQFPFVNVSFKVTSDYGPRWGTTHAGIDLVAFHGAPVHSIADGTVVDARRSPSYGNLVTIKHPNGLFTRYTHLDRLMAVTGQNVKKGQQIGTQGNTGDSSASHLHFEVRKGNDIGPGTSFDPRKILAFPKSLYPNN